MSEYLKRFRKAVWSQPDPLLMAAGTRGEHIVARTRLALAGLLLLIPFGNLFFRSNRIESLVGLGATGIVFVISLIVFLAVRRDHQWPWLGFASSCFDVTLISAALASFFLLDQPHT